MKKNDILKTGEFFPENEKNLVSVFRIKIFVPVFAKEIEVQGYNLKDLKSDRTESDNLVRTINELANFDIENLNWLKEKIWNHYDSYMQTTSYGMIEYDTNHSEWEVNRNYFGIYDSDQAYKNTELKLIHFDCSQLDFQHFNLEFSCPWDEEHGILICVSEGGFDSIS